MKNYVLNHFIILVGTNDLESNKRAESIANTITLQCPWKMTNMMQAYQILFFKRGMNEKGCFMNSILA